MKSLKSSFARYLRTIGYGPSSQNMMNFALSELLDYYPDIATISKRDIENYATYLSGRPNRKRSGGLSSSMLRQYLYGLKVFFSWCEQTGRIRLNPMSGYVLPEVESSVRAILSEQEIRRLYEVCESYQDRALLGLFYGCGLRRSEGEKLNAMDIHFREGLLYIRKGKGGKRRVIPLSRAVRHDLVNYYREERGHHPDQRAFMLNGWGLRMKGNTYNDRLKQLVSKAGIGKAVSLHSLRHSIATHLLNKGLRLEQVRDFLGHAHLETTQLYTHASAIEGDKRGSRPP